MRTSTGLHALVLTAALALSLPVANAQSQQNQAPSSSPPSATTSPSSSPSADIPDQKLDAAAAAVKGVTAVKENYQQKLAEAPTVDKERIVGEAQAAMAKAVTDQGLSVEEYTAILQVAQNNQTVQDKIIQRLK
jgi:hypothetical protein